MIFYTLLLVQCLPYRIKNELRVYVTNEKLPYQLRGTYFRIPRERPLAYANENDKILLRYDPTQRVWLVQDRVR